MAEVTGWFGIGWYGTGYKGREGEEKRIEGNEREIKKSGMRRKEKKKIKRREEGEKLKSKVRKEFKAGIQQNINQ